jgi:hypothetical protein
MLVVDEEANAPKRWGDSPRMEAVEEVGKSTRKSKLDEYAKPCT